MLGARADVAWTPRCRCRTQSPSGKVLGAHHLAESGCEPLVDGSWRHSGRVQREKVGRTNLLLVLLVDGIHGVLDGDALHAPCGDMQAQGEVKINFLDWWLGQV